MDVENLGSSVALSESISNDMMTRPQDHHQLPSSSSSSSSLPSPPPQPAPSSPQPQARRTSMTSRSQAQNTPPHSDQHQNQKLNPIIAILQQQELGRAVFTNAVTMITGILLLFYSSKSKPLVVQLIVIALLFGCAAIWNGILLREAYPDPANAVEQIGIGIVFLAFVGMVGLFLPLHLLWVPGFCFCLFILPLIISVFPHKSQPRR